MLARRAPGCEAGVGVEFNARSAESIHSETNRPEGRDSVPTVVEAAAPSLRSRLWERLGGGSGLVLAVLCVAIVVVEVLVRSRDAVFEAEHDLFFSDARRWVHGGAFPLHGPPVGPFAVDHGPVFALLVAPIVALIPSPAAIQLSFVVLACVAVFVFGRALWPVTGPLPALAAVVGLAGSGYFHESARQVWHSSLLPLPMVVVLWLTAAATKHACVRRFALAGVIAALAVQLHVQAAGLAVAWAVCVGLSAPRLGPARTLAVLALAAASLAPIALSWGSLIDARGLDAVLGHRPNALDTTRLGTLVELLVRGFGIASWPDAWLVGSTWLELAVIGAVTALRRPDPLPRVLALAFVAGLAVLWPLAGYMPAPRFLHTIAFPGFGLAALGLVTVAGWLGGAERVPVALRVATLLSAAAYGVGVALPATFDVLPVLSSHAQAQVVDEVVARVGSTADVRRQVHGLYLSDPALLIGMGYHHDVAASNPQPAKSDAHLAVLPLSLAKDLTLGSGEIVRTPLATWPTPVVLVEYTPIFDALTGDEALFDKWPRGGPPPTAGPYALSARVRRPGVILVWIRRHGRPASECQLSVTLSGVSLPTQVLESQRQPEVHRLDVPRAGALELRLGPCSRAVHLDVM